VNIQLHNGLAIKGREVTEDMYSSIDLVMAKIERQVRRYKEKIRGHKARVDLSSIPVQHHVFAAEAVDVSGDGARVGAPAAPPVEMGPQIIKTTKFAAAPMDVREAVMQMNLLGNTFLVFRNSQSGQVNVVYKRDDGNYGLIETGPPSAA
jgi:putative sigma-54 modulation protein